MSREARVVVLRTEEHKKVACNLIADPSITPLPVDEHDKPFEVVIQRVDPGHSGPQHRLIWRLLSLIEKHVPYEGNLYPREWWNHRLKIEFGFVADTIPMTVNGVKVDVPVPKTLSTSAKGHYRMTVSEATEYYQQLEAFAVGRGVSVEEG